jgi:hypothetical protein
MRKTIYVITFLFVFISCGVKKTQSLLSDGNYDAAISRAIESLRTKKNSKGKQEYVYLLEEAFAKAKERDLRRVDMLSKESNPANYEQIYNTYTGLNDRQERIRPLLPLMLVKENRDAIFPFDNYTQNIVDSKNALSKYLYDNAMVLLKSNNKYDYRKAYDDLEYLEKLSPGFKDVRKRMDEAKFKGTDFVNVYTKNETNMVIPVRLQKDLLDFSTYGLNDRWTVYHNNRQKGISYDFGMLINFRQITISPEQVKEKEFIKEKQIKDGTKPLLDSNGNVVKDSLGKQINVDNFKNIRVNIYEFRQFKSCQVAAKVDYIDLKAGNQLIEAFPVTSEFVFEHIYATYNGDRNACDDNYLPFFNNRAVPFPSSEQMVYDAGEDLKLKLKDIITRNRFRRQ